MDSMQLGTDPIDYGCLSNEKESVIDFPSIDQVCTMDCFLKLTFPNVYVDGLEAMVHTMVQFY